MQPGTLRSIVAVSLASLLLLLPSSRALSSSPSSAARTTPPAPSSLVRVWDGVFEPNHLRSLADAVDDRRNAFSTASDSFLTVYDRREGEGEGEARRRLGRGRTVLEAAATSVLDALGDGSRYVEYWVRDEWRDLAVHRDVDEGALEGPPRDDGGGASRLQRCPKFGHVLYVDVEPALRCPTCVFREEDAENAEGDDDDDHPDLVDGGRRGGPPRPLIELLVVPASDNRLLRFRGDALHSVPRSALSYFETDEVVEERRGGGWSSLFRNGKNPRRVVILFNSWDDPPPAHSKTASLPSFQPMAEFAKLAADDRRPPRCGARKEWEEPSFLRWSSAEGRERRRDGNGRRRRRPKPADLVAPLLGDRARRGGAEEDCLLATTRSMAFARTALLSSHDVHCIQLETSRNAEI